MLIEADQKEFKNRFIKQPHPFLSLSFLEMNRHKVERLVYLLENKNKKVGLGIVAGIKKDVLMSPFSAPFGGFHFRHNNIKIKEIDSFLVQLKNYIINNGLQKINLTLPPDIYHRSFNAKMINTLIRNEFKMEIPEITNWIDLNKFKDAFADSNSRTNYNKAVKNNLVFEVVTEIVQKERAFDLISENRGKYGRPIYMTLEDILKTEKLWPVDYFQVRDMGNSLLASAVFYRASPKIIYGAFWGDNDLGRSLKAMDFQAFCIWNYYKELKYDFIDFGISTESGTPNEGLLRFKEAHDSTSSLRYSFVWHNNKYN